MTAAFSVQLGQQVRSRSGRPAGQVVAIDGSLLRVRGLGREMVVDANEAFAQVGDTLVLDCEPESLRDAPAAGVPLAAAFAVAPVAGSRFFRPRMFVAGSALLLGAAIVAGSLSLLPRNAARRE